jgi:hypothetical protein
MLQKTLLGAALKRGWADPVHDPDLLLINLHFLINARTISRRVSQPAPSNPSDTRLANSSNWPITSLNSASRSSASAPCLCSSSSLDSRSLAAVTRGSNSDLSRRPSPYASINREIVFLTWLISLAT